MTLSDAERQELEELRRFKENWVRWTVIDLRVEDDKATIEARGELIRGLTVMLVEWFLKDAKAENYAELSVFHEETGPLAMTVQRIWGKTPHELKVEAEEKLSKLGEEFDRRAIQLNALRVGYKVARKHAKDLRAANDPSRVIGPAVPPDSPILEDE